MIHNDFSETINIIKILIRILGSFERVQWELDLRLQ